jgi:hypothetical protein
MNLKNIKFLIIVGCLVQAAWAGTLHNIDQELRQVLTPSETAKSLSELKKIAEKRSVDVDVAYEQYVQTKREVSIARAAFSPLSTGHLLGTALGLNYLWTPIIIEAVLSIPSKWYKIKKQKYIRRASYHHFLNVKSIIKNEMAHLYYDILSHEMILKTLDLEMELLSERRQSLEDVDSEEYEDKIRNLDRNVIELNIKKIDFFNLYTAEVAAFRNLMTLDINSEQLELAPFSSTLPVDIATDLNMKKVEKKALANSNEYKTATNLYYAAKANQKSVKWSLLSFRGFNFSYKGRVRQAKSETKTYKLMRKAAALKVKNGVYDYLHKLESGLRVSEHYSAQFYDALTLYDDVRSGAEHNLMGQGFLLQVSIDLIQQFRDSVMANYRAWSALDDFSKAASRKFDVMDNQLTDGGKRVENDPYYDIKASEFKAYGKLWYGDDRVKIELRSKKLDLVDHVVYRFNDWRLSRAKGKSRKKKFRAWSYAHEELYGDVAGKATVHLKDGSELTFKFKLDRR